MSADVVGKNFAAFDAIANGEYNEGDVVLEGPGLAKVNAHHTFTILNGKTLTGEENEAVRRALYDAIKDDGRGQALSEAQLAAIRKRLGLEGGQKDVVETPLSRREVRQILSFVKEASLTEREYATEMRTHLGKCIDKLDLGFSEKARLRLNLLGENGELRQLLTVIGESLTGKFSRQIVTNLACTADPQRNTARPMALRVLKSCEKYIANVAVFTRQAHAAARETGDWEGKAFLDYIAGMKETLAGLGAAPGESQAALALLDEAQLAAETLATELVNDVDNKLARLKEADFLPGSEAQKLADAFVHERLLVRHAEIQKLLREATTKILGLAERLRLAAEAREQARAEKLEKGREAMGKLLTDLSKTLADRSAQLAALRESASALQEATRADERLEGDAFAQAMDKTEALHRKTLEAEKALTTRYREQLGGLSAETVEECQQELEKKVAALKKEEEEKINGLLAELNGKLAYTVVPKLGEDPAAAAAATAERRAKLTKELGAAWDAAAAEFSKLVLSLETFRKNDAAFDFLSPEEERAAAERLARLQARFSAEAREDYVTRHAVGGPTPQAILKKAAADLVRLQENLKAANLAAAAKAAEGKLALIGAWVRREPAAMASFEADFEKLSGVSLSALAGGKAETLAALRRTALFLLDSDQDAYNALARKMRAAAHAGGPVVEGLLRETLATVAKKMAALAGRLREKEVIARAAEAPRLFASVAKDLLAARAAERDTTLRALADRLLEGLHYRIDAKFVLEGAPTEGLGPLAAEILAFYRRASRAHALRLDYLERLQSEIRKPGADPERLNALIRELSLDDAEMGLKPTLSVEELESMRSGVISKTFAVARAETVIAEGERREGVNEALLASLPPDVKVELGLALAPCAIDEGLDEKIVEGDVADPRPLPRLDLSLSV